MTQELEHTLKELILSHDWYDILDALATLATDEARTLRRNYHDEFGAKKFFQLENTLRTARITLQQRPIKQG